MNEPMFEPKFIDSAANEFLARTPEYIPTATNYQIIGQEAQKLVDDGADPRSVSTYSEAFKIAKSKNLLVLNKPAPKEYALQAYNEYQSPEFFRSLSVEDKERFGERLAKLNKTDPRQIEALPEHLARFFCEYELRQSRKVAPLNDGAQLLLATLLSKGFSGSPKNKAILVGWLNKRDLLETGQNLVLAVDACAEHLDPSDLAISKMSASEYRKKIADPDAKKRQAEIDKQPKPKRNGPPPGFSFVNWINGQ